MKILQNSPQVHIRCRQIYKKSTRNNSKSWKFQPTLQMSPSISKPHESHPNILQSLKLPQSPQIHPISLLLPQFGL